MLREPRRIRDRDQVRYVTRQSCLICGRRPSDAHHLRFAQNRALSHKVSDEFTVPLCRGHHREVHRSGDEAVWWAKAAIDPTVVAARYGWKLTHQFRAKRRPTETRSSKLSTAAVREKPRTPGGPACEAQITKQSQLRKWLPLNDFVQADLCESPQRAQKHWPSY